MTNRQPINAIRRLHQFEIGVPAVLQPGLELMFASLALKRSGIVLQHDRTFIQVGYPTSWLTTPPQEITIIGDSPHTRGEKTLTTARNGWFSIAFMTKMLYGCCLSTA